MRSFEYISILEWDFQIHRCGKEAIYILVDLILVELLGFILYEKARGAIQHKANEIILTIR